MAKKIFKPLGKLIGGGKKKAAQEQKGPIVTPLGMEGQGSFRRWGERQKNMKRKNNLGASDLNTILSDRLGG